MPLRLIPVPSLGKRLANLMAHPASPDLAANERALDAYYRLGGNGIHLADEGDSTHGRRTTGHWLRRHPRGDFFLCGAICHDGWNETTREPIDRFTADAVALDIERDLTLLGTDYLDLVYLPDNPRAAFEPVVDALAREMARGRVRAFGVGHWSAERIQAAHTYASRSSGPTPRVVITTELALARATRPLWPEYSPFTPSLAAVVRTLGLAVFAHVGDLNQGQCLFGGEDKLARMRPEWVERWNHPANLGVAPKVINFAGARGLTSREVNVAYVLNQDFPVVGLVSAPAFLEPRGTEYERAAGLNWDHATVDALRSLAPSLR